MEECIAKWESLGLNLLPPRTEVGVVAALQTTGLAFSRDVVQLYLLTGGMTSDEMDPHLFQLWTLDRVTEENARHQSPLLLFGDMSIDSYFFGFRYESAERSSVCVDYLNGDPPHVVSNGVGEFFDLIWTHPDAVALYGGY
ncbi:MAG: hypothetical protein ABIP75_05415 [Pyrinomonadaceae bacterium]